MLLQTWVEATSYLQLVGILMGQLLFGFMGDWIGRRATMLIDMSVILIGVLMLVTSNGATEQVCFIPTLPPSPPLPLLSPLVYQLFGFAGDWICRQATMLIDMSVILIGVLMLVTSNGATEQVCSQSQHPPPPPSLCLRLHLLLAERVENDQARYSC